MSPVSKAVKHLSSSSSSKKPAAFPRVVTLLSSKSMERVELFNSPHHHIVLYDYSSGLSPPAPPLRCSFCTFTYPSRGVKWEQMDHFLGSDWARANLARYDWLWYPDDDITFAPGQLDKFLQMPFGRVAWWNAIHAPVLKNQTLGLGIDFVWSGPLGKELRSGIYDDACAYHPDRPEGHRTGRECTTCSPNVPDEHEIFVANSRRFGFKVEKEFIDYEPNFQRFRRVARLSAAGSCAASCAATSGGKCLGSLPASAEECASDEAASSAAAGGGGAPITRWDPRNDTFDRGGCRSPEGASDDADDDDPTANQMAAAAPPPAAPLCCVCLEPDAAWPGGVASSMELKKHGLPFGFNASVLLADLPPAPPAPPPSSSPPPASGSAKKKPAPVRRLPLPPPAARHVVVSTDAGDGH